MILLNSIVKSKRIIGREAVGSVKGRVIAPNIRTLTEKRFKELRNLTITQVQWTDSLSTLGFTLSDNKTCNAGRFSFHHNHTFDPTKKITSIQIIINMDEIWINQINFYHNEERLVAVGA